MRESAKWLVASGGAVATVIFAGVSLSSLGKLTPSTPEYRLTWAVLGLTVAILGVVAILILAVSVVRQGSLSVQEFAANSARRPWKRILEALFDPSGLFIQGVQADNLQELIELAKNDDVAGRNLKRVVDAASTRRMRLFFKHAVIGIAAAMVMTVAGAAVFAWASNPPDAAVSPSAPSLLPMSVRLTLNTGAAGELSTQFGCPPPRN